MKIDAYKNEATIHPRDLLRRVWFEENLLTKEEWHHVDGVQVSCECNQLLLVHVRFSDQLQSGLVLRLMKAFRLTPDGWEVAK